MGFLPNAPKKGYDQIRVILCWGFLHIPAKTIIPEKTLLTLKALGNILSSLMKSELRTIGIATVRRFTSRPGITEKRGSGRSES
jgi:hypothetical protein